MVSHAKTNPGPGEESAPLTAGVVLDRYRVEGKLREGGMASIYLGEHVNTGARVALKVLHAEYAHQPEFVARFDREAHVMGQLSDCPNIAQVYDVGSLPDGRRYLAMEFVRGTDLDDLLLEHRSNDEAFDLLRACRLMRDVARGLQAAHAKRIVHRDLKPSNIMVEQRRGSAERAKLLDFGVSADLGTKGKSDALTATGTVIGTAQYMAPEQAAGIAASESFDLYALGVVMFELLTGQAPPSNGWRAGALPDVATLRAGLPEGVRSVVHDCLVVDSTQRVQSASEVANRLDKVVADLEGPAARLKRWAHARPSAAAGTVRGATGPLTPPPQPSVIVEPTPLPGPLPRASTEPAPAAPVVPPVAAATSLPPATPARRSGGGGTAIIAATLVAVGLGLVGTWTISRRDGDPAEVPAAALEPEPHAIAALDIGTARREAPLPEVTHDSAPVVAPTTAIEPVEDPPQPPEPTVDPVPKTPTTPKRIDKANQPNRAEPAPQTPPAAAPEPAPSESTPAANCGDPRGDANAARMAMDWKGVLGATDDSRCWAGHLEDRRELRVEALSELGRYDACVKTAGTGGSRKVQKTAEFCRKQLNQP